MLKPDKPVFVKKVTNKSKPSRSHKRDWSREFFYSGPKSLTI